MCGLRERQSERCWAASAYARLGVEPPASATWPDAPARSPPPARRPRPCRRGPRASPRDHRPCRGQRRLVGAVAQQRLAHALAEDAALAARRAHDRELAALAVAGAAHLAQPARARSSETDAPDALSIVTPDSPGALDLLDRLQRDLARRRACRSRRHTRSSPRRISVAGVQFSRDASQPANSAGGRDGVLAVADRDGADRGAARARNAAGSKAAATRSRHGVERSHARSTT